MLLIKLPFWNNHVMYFNSRKSGSFNYSWKVTAEIRTERSTDDW